MGLKVFLEEDVLHEGGKLIFRKELKGKILLGPQFLEGVTLGGNRLSRGDLARVSPANKAPVIEVLDNHVVIRDQGNPFVFNESLSRTDRPTEARPGIHILKVDVITFTMTIEETK